MILPEHTSGERGASSNSATSRLKIKKGSSSHVHSHLGSSPDPIPPLHSAFAMAETLQLLIQQDPFNVDRLITVPESFLAGGNVRSDGSPSEGDNSRGKGRRGSGDSSSGHGKETDLWILEHLRRLPLDLNPLLTSLLPICTRATCPEMRADDWMYVCVAHPVGLNGQVGGGSGVPGVGSIAHGGDGGTGGHESGAGSERECCAIDYILHTIDSHTALLNSSHAFPSRLTMKPGSERHFPQQARRLSRIFAHAYHHHRSTFLASESETGLYARFVGLVEKYDLVEVGMLGVPKEEVERVLTRRESRVRHDHPDSKDEQLGSPEEGSLPQRGPAEVDLEDDGHVERGLAQSERLGDGLYPISKDDDDDADFIRRGPAPSTSHKITTGTLGRSAGRNAGRGKARRALFAVDVVPEQEEDDDVADNQDKEEDQPDAGTAELSASSTDLAAAFFQRFRDKSDEIRSVLESHGPPADAKVILADLRGEISEATAYLPAHDQAQYERKWKELEKAITDGQARDPANGIKSKFSFKRNVPVLSPGKQAEDLPAPPSDASSGEEQQAEDQQADTPVPSTSHSIRSQQDAYIVSPIPRPASEKQDIDRSYSLAIADMTRCHVDLLSTLDDPEDGDEHDEEHGLTALYINDVEDSIIVAPIIGGSVMVTNAKGCLIIAGCQQFRMHQSSDCTVLLQIPSSPIIEHSSQIRFGPHPSPFDTDSKYRDVLDFDWVRPGPSPNWFEWNPEDDETDAADRKTRALVLASAKERQEIGADERGWQEAVFGHAQADNRPETAPTQLSQGKDDGASS